MIQAALTELVSALQTEEAKRALSEALYTDVLRPQFRLGGEDGLVKAIQQAAQSELRVQAVAPAIERGAVDLSRVYENERRNATMVMGACLAAAGVFAGIVAYGLVLALTGALAPKLFHASIAGIPAFLSALLYWLYRSERNQLAALEGEIRTIEVFRNQIEIAEMIGDAARRDEAYGIIIANLRKSTGQRRAPAVRSAGPGKRSGG